MNNYSPKRVGIAGVTGDAGIELLRRLARHPHSTVTCAMASSGSSGRKLPSLTRIWDGAVETIDVERLSDNDAVCLALPDTAAAELAPVLASRGAKVFD